MKILQQQAWVLHTRAYRESSLLIELFTREYGRVALVGKGVRSKKKAPPPRQFLPALVSWVGRGPLFTLTDCELESGLGLHGDALACGFYLNELLLRMTQPLDVHSKLFAAYSSTIRTLASDGSRSAALRSFEHTLLQECGYAPDFSCCELGEPLKHDGNYELFADRGFVEVAASERSATGEQLLAVGNNDYRTKAVRKVARRLFQAALQPHLGDRPLASRELLRPQVRS